MATERAKAVCELAGHLFRQALHANRDLDPGHATKDAMALWRWATSLHTLAEYACNGELTKAQEKRDASLTAKVNAKLAEYGIKAKHNGDPRGYAVKILFTYATPAERNPYNTWGGAEDGWGIGS